MKPRKIIVNNKEYFWRAGKYKVTVSTKRQGKIIESEIKSYYDDSDGQINDPPGGVTPGYVRKLIEEYLINLDV